jgi:hypothetical protein
VWVMPPRWLRTEGDRTLVGMKYVWLESPGSMLPARRSLLSRLKDVYIRTGRAWTLKEAASRLWDYVSVGWARKAIACGYRNRECFRNAILFYLGGLDLYPRPASAHTTS